jgi:hypothetical protein
MGDAPVLDTLFIDTGIIPNHRLEIVQNDNVLHFANSKRTA